MNSKQNKKRNNNRNNNMAVASRGASSSSSLGSLVGKAVNVAKSIPVLGSVVDTAETVASSILSFFGLGSAMFQAHYNSRGVKFALAHGHVESKGDEYTTANTAVAPGSILLRYELSIGPQGSRSRRMGENFEKYIMKGFQLSVTATCAATEPGQLAYVYVPDPLDRTLDSMDESKRLEAILGRDNVQLAQIWQNTLLSFAIPERTFFVQPEAGDLRFASPGAVYVIAVTSVDPLKLPTLRQTSNLRFSKATSAPVSSDVQMMLSTYSVAELSNLVTPILNVDIVGSLSSRVSEDMEFPDPAGPLMQTPGLQVFAGETIYMSVSSTTEYGSVAIFGGAIMYFTPLGGTGTISGTIPGMTQVATGADAAKVGFLTVYKLTAPSDGYVWASNATNFTVTAGKPTLELTWLVVPSSGLPLPPRSINTTDALRVSIAGSGLRCSAVSRSRHAEPMKAVVQDDVKSISSVSSNPNQRVARR